MAAYDGRQHRRGGLLFQRGQQRRGKALGLLAAVFNGDDLRKNRKCDLLCGFCANGKPNGRVQGINALLRQPQLGQLCVHQSRALPAAHHAHIGGGLLQNRTQAGNITAVGTGHDHKVCLLPAGDLRKTLCKGQAEHSIGPGLTQLLRKLGAVLQRCDRQTQQLCQPHHRRAHMAAAADHKLRGCAKALHKDALSG